MSAEDTTLPGIQVEGEKDNDGSLSSENGTDSGSEKTKTRKIRLLPRASKDRRDSGSSVGDDEDITELTDELREKIVIQAEYYFSDENLKRDGFLLKHVKRNKEGYVNLKLLASFKKMRSLSRDYRVIGEALAGSKKLVVNDTGLKVRRVEPLPKELLAQIRVKHVVVSSIPNENPSMNYITEAFANHKDEVVSVRIVKPGKKFPNDLQSHFSRHPDLRNEIVAVIEFDNPHIASEAVKIVFSGNYNGIHVQLLELGPKQAKRMENGDTASSDTPVDSDASTGGKERKKKKNGNRLLEVSGKDDSYSSYASSSDGEFSSFSSCSKRYNRSHGSSPASSPKPARRFDRNNNSKNNSPMSSPNLSPKFPKKITKHTPDHSPVGDTHKLSPLVVNNSPRSSPEMSRHKIKTSNETSAVQSAWMLKRMQINGNNSDSESIKAGLKQLEIIRQPKGPDGSNGFINHPFKKYVLVHAC